MIDRSSRSIFTLTQFSVTVDLFSSESLGRFYWSSKEVVKLNYRKSIKLIMQGNLGEIDIRSILQLIELGQRTGELFVEAYQSPSQTLVSGENACWFVFFVNGQIVYAVDKSYGQLKRLRDYLRRFNLADQIQLVSLDHGVISTTNDPEYGYLWLLLEKNILTPVQARNIIRSMVQEVLFDLLSLWQGAFIFEMGTALDPPLTAFEISPFILQMAKQVQEWKQFHPFVQSPDQMIAIADQPKLASVLSEKLYQRLITWAKNKSSLRQLSRYLHRDLPMVARSLAPYIERGLLFMIDPPRPVSQPKPISPWDTYPSITLPQVVCIDDERTVGKQTELILSRQGYVVSYFNDPLEALQQLFQLKPDLILCDISMPKLDGYEICAMLRHSIVFRQTPIIMLTGKDAFMDRVRAHLVGATDYLTKPFSEGELLLLLESYLPVQHRANASYF